MRDVHTTYTTTDMIKKEGKRGGGGGVEEVNKDEMQ